MYAIEHIHGPDSAHDYNSTCSYYSNAKQQQQKLRCFFYLSSKKQFRNSHIEQCKDMRKREHTKKKQPLSSISPMNHYLRAFGSCKPCSRICGITFAHDYTIRIDLLFRGLIFGNYNLGYGFGRILFYQQFIFYWQHTPWIEHTSL